MKGWFKTTEGYVNAQHILAIQIVKRKDEYAIVAYPNNTHWIEYSLSYHMTAQEASAALDAHLMVCLGDN